MNSINRRFLHKLLSYKNNGFVILLRMLLTNSKVGVIIMIRNLCNGSELPMLKRFEVENYMGFAEHSTFQSVLTTHNTYLMQNKLTRPDCCFLMTKNNISNLYDATDREIRESHNLEKMYINGAFTE